MKLLWTLLLCMLASTLVLAGVQITDDKGHDVRLEQAPKRIVSLYPSLTEAVCALGRCQDLVGVDRYSNFPASVRALPQLGGGLDPQIEAVFALKPDLVLAATSSPGAERLAALGLKVVQFEPKDYADTVRIVRTLAKLLGVADAQAVIAQIDADFAAALAQMPAQAQGKKVYFEVSTAPYAAGASSFIGQTLQRLGLVNIVGPELGPFPKINPELVVRAQPDIVVVADSSLAGMAERPGWSQVRALQAHRVCTLNKDDGDVLVRAGPRMGQGALRLAQCLRRLYPTKASP
jgi:iron complex transport system substrate-binding protein